MSELVVSAVLIYLIFGEKESGSMETTEIELGTLVTAGVALLGLISVVLTMYVVAALKNSVEDESLGLPAGSVRALLAIMIVGGFIVFLFFGESIAPESFDKVLAAYGTLVGAVSGFYFGAKSSRANLPVPSVPGPIPTAPADGGTGLSIASNPDRP